MMQGFDDLSLSDEANCKEEKKAITFKMLLRMELLKNKKAKVKKC